MHVNCISPNFHAFNFTTCTNCPVECETHRYTILYHDSLSLTGYLDVGDRCWTHIQKYYDVSDLFKCNQHAENVTNIVFWHFFLKLWLLQLCSKCRIYRISWIYIAFLGDFSQTENWKLGCSYSWVSGKNYLALGIKVYGVPYTAYLQVSKGLRASFYHLVLMW